MSFLRAGCDKERRSSFPAAYVSPDSSPCLSSRAYPGKATSRGSFPRFRARFGEASAVIASPLDALPSPAPITPRRKPVPRSPDAHKRTSSPGIGSRVNILQVQMDRVEKMAGTYGAASPPCDGSPAFLLPPLTAAHLRNREGRTSAPKRLRPNWHARPDLNEDLRFWRPAFCR